MVGIFFPDSIAYAKVLNNFGKLSNDNLIYNHPIATLTGKNISGRTIQTQITFL